MRRLENFLFPAAMVVEGEEVLDTDESDQGSGLGLGSIMLPAMLLMSVLFIAQGMSEDIWKEKQRLILKNQTHQFVAGKISRVQWDLLRLRDTGPPESS